MDGQASKNAEETPQTESVEKKKPPSKTAFRLVGESGLYLLQFSF